MPPRVKQISRTFPSFSTSSSAKNTLVLVDGLNALFRHHYARAASPVLLPKDGRVVSGLAGLCREVLHVINTLHPKYLAVCLDSPTRTLRKHLFPQYKSGRPTIQDDLRWQVLQIEPMMKEFGVPVAYSPGFECDDVIATLAARGMRIASQRRRSQLDHPTSHSYQKHSLVHHDHDHQTQESSHLSSTLSSSDVLKPQSQALHHPSATLLARLRRLLLLDDGIVTPDDLLLPPPSSPSSSPSPSSPPSSSLLSLSPGEMETLSTHEHLLNDIESMNDQIGLNDEMNETSTEIDHVYIVSWDKDFAQLVCDDITLVKIVNGHPEFTTPQSIQTKVCCLKVVRYSFFLLFLSLFLSPFSLLMMETLVHSYC